MSDLRGRRAMFGLNQGEVHVWHAWLPQDAARLQYLEDTLSSDERARSDRFHFAKGRAEFVGTRGLLRLLLSRYLNTEPRSVQFSYRCVCRSARCTVTQQKPILAETGPGSGLSFNASHSHGLAAYAFCLGREVGIDVELVRPAIAFEGIEAEYLPSRESDALRRMPVDSQPEAFFRSWTRREAALKARGRGLARPLDTVFDEATWFVQNFAPAPHYAGAVALEGTDDVTVRWSTWNDSTSDSAA